MKSSFVRYETKAHFSLFECCSTQTLAMTFTLYRHRADHLFLPSCCVPCERTANTILKIFGMTRPGIESATSRKGNALTSDKDSNEWFICYPIINHLHIYLYLQYYTTTFTFSKFWFRIWLAFQLLLFLFVFINHQTTHMFDHLEHWRHLAFHSLYVFSNLAYVILHELESLDYMLKKYL